MVKERKRTQLAYMGALALALLFVGQVASWAMDDQGATFVRGVGNSSCTDYLGAYALADFKQLADGGSQYNVVGRSDWFNMNGPEMAAWLASWCRDNPEQTLWFGVKTLTKQRLEEQ